jgi:hypothetical protein
LNRNLKTALMGGFFMLKEGRSQRWRQKSS